MRLVAVQAIEFLDILKIRSVFGEIREFNAHERILLEKKSVEAALPKQLRDFKDRDLGHGDGFISTELASILNHYLLLDIHYIFA
jgi:hypothetical protein